MKKLLSVRNLLSPYREPEMKIFLLCMFVFGISAGMYTGVLNNYLHEILHITRVERGIVELPRELPGLLLFLLMAALHRFSEIKLMKIAFALSLIGLLGLGFFGSGRALGILLIVLFSWGEHIMMPIRQSVAIHSAHRGKEGLAMGGTSAVGNLGQVAGYYLVPLVFFLVSLVFSKRMPITPYRTVFFAAGIAMLAALFLSWRLKGMDRPVQRERLYFRRRYAKYYILEAFFGARKQVFITFAPYVLILKYGAKTELIATLHGIWALANIFVAPLMGRLVDRIGYKKIIVADTFILILLCLLYGFSHLLFSQSVAFILVCCTFVLDAILFVLGMARAMYVKSISGSQEEVTSALGTGISINHLISILIAILGGVLWEKLGIEALFGIAAVFGFGTFLFSLSLPRPVLSSAVEETAR